MKESKKQARPNSCMVTLAPTGLLLVALHLNVQAFESGKPEPKYSKQYTSCMEKTDGVTVEMRACINTELVQQDERLNQVYRRYANSVSSSVRKSLKEAQRAWVQFRDKECLWAGAPEGDGTLGPVIVDNCHLELTARRADEIENLLFHK